MTLSRSRGLRGAASASSLLLVVLGACGGSESSTPPETETPPPGTVGTTGGTVAHASGDATVVVPAGALGADVQITVQPLSTPPADPNLLSGSSWSFGPSGTQFSKPVEMRLAYDPARIPAGLPEAALFIAKNVGGVWTRIEGEVVVDSAQNAVRGYVTSFSDYAVLADACHRTGIVVGASVSGTLRDGDCVYVESGTGTQRLEDLFRIETAEPRALRLTVEATGFRPGLGLTAFAEVPFEGPVYGFRSASEGGASTFLDILVPAGVWEVFASNHDGLGAGSYTLGVTERSPVNDIGCFFFYLRPPYTGNQAIDGGSDCIQTITVSPDPDFVGAEIAEEYFRVKVLAGQTLRVTATRVSGETRFAPFPTIFVPAHLGGGAIQDPTEGTTRSVSFTASADAWLNVAVSSTFTDLPSNGGRYTEGSYQLDVRVEG